MSFDNIMKKSIKSKKKEIKKKKKSDSLTFGCVKPFIAKTDAIQIMTVSNDGDVEDNWINKDLVPKRYDGMELIGFCALDNICCRDIDVPLRGIEFYLDDVGYPKED